MERVLPEEMVSGIAGLRKYLIDIFLHHCKRFLSVPSSQVLVAGQGCDQGQVGSSSGVGELFGLAEDKGLSGDPAGEEPR